MAVTIRNSPAITPISENRTDSIRFFASKDCLTKMSPPPRKVRPRTKHIIRLAISIFRHRPQRLHFLLKIIIARLFSRFRQTQKEKERDCQKNDRYGYRRCIDKKAVFLLLLVTDCGSHANLRTNFRPGRGRLQKSRRLDRSRRIAAG